MSILERIENAVVEGYKKIEDGVVGKVAYGVISALVLGIVMLLFLIPMCVGLKESK